MGLSKIRDLVKVKDEIKTSIKNKGVLVDVGLYQYGDEIRSIKKEQVIYRNSWVWDGTTLFRGSWAPPLSFKNVNYIDESPFEYSDVETVNIYDTSHLTSMDDLFYQCENLKTVNEFDASGLDYDGLQGAFYGCTNLENVGGFIGLKVKLDMSDSVNLTYRSLMNIINNLAEVSTTTTLTLGETNLAKLSEDDIAIAINKGWSITA